jgi:hypothetical protein
MKSILTLILFGLPFLSFSNIPIRFDNDSVRVTLSMDKHHIEKDTDLLVHISITSVQRRIVQLPKGDNMAYINEGNGFYLIQCQKQMGSKYTDLSGVAHIDNLPLIKFDTLHSNETYKFETSIRLLYRYTEGQYRIRILATFSALNKMPDVYSDWLYFDCPTDVKIE